MYKVGILRAGPRRLQTYQPIRFIQRLSSPELRSRFVTYFEEQGHTKVKSASLIPHNDKSLLFTNAGTHI